MSYHLPGETRALKARQEMGEKASITKDQDRTRLRFVQMVRAFCCLTVAWSHLAELFLMRPGVAAQLGHFPPLTEPPQPVYLALTRFWQSYGVFPEKVAMGLFFLTSGFVIPYSLRHRSLAGFFIVRFFRLYPTLWLNLALLTAVLIGQSYRWGLPFPFTPATIAGNALLINSYFGQPFVEAACWSLAVEELFYATAAVCAWRRLLANAPVVLAISTAATIVSIAIPLVPIPTGLHPRWQVASFLTSYYMAQFIPTFIGVALHHLYRHVWSLRLGITVIAIQVILYALCLFVDPNDAKEGYLIAIPLALSLFTILMLSNDRLPYISVLDRIAEMSYPLYIMHATNGYVLLHTLFLWTGRFYTSLALTGMVVAIAAALVHRYFEWPLYRFGRRLADHVGREPSVPLEPGMLEPIDAIWSHRRNQAAK